MAPRMVLPALVLLSLLFNMAAAQIEAAAAAAEAAGAIMQAQADVVPSIDAETAARMPGPLHLDPYQQGLSDGGVYRCSTPALSEAQKARTERYIQTVMAARAASGEVDIMAGPINIGVHFHVIVGSGDTGNVSNKAVGEQIQVLNAAFAPHFTFSLLSVSRTVNNNWFTSLSPGSSYEQQAKAALKKGTMQHLNLYTAELADKLLGWAYLPSTIGRSNAWQDGVVCLHSSLPGGSRDPYNLGDTAVHEVAHFLGLYHTFEGGCGGAGDQIADTAPEASAAKGCPVGRDSCTGNGVDDISNFMDYTTDACMNHFTPGQFQKMKQVWATYRQGK